MLDFPIMLSQLDFDTSPQTRRRVDRLPCFVPIASPFGRKYLATRLLPSWVVAGMGIVYQREQSLGVVMWHSSLLPAEYTADSERLERFLRQARTASALNHPHICTIHGLGEHNGRPFIVMEFIEGRTLQAMIQSDRRLTKRCG